MEKAKTKVIVRRGLIGLLIFSLFFLEGCWGKREVEQLAFVMALGIDQGKNPGTYDITYQIAQPKKGGQSGSEIDNWTISTEVAHAPIAENNIYEVLNRHPFVGTTKVMIIGEDLAKSGLNDALDAFQRFYQFRRTLYLLVAKGTAKDILNTKLRNDQLPALSLLGRMEQNKAVSTFPVTRIGHYLTLLAEEGQAPIIPVVERLKPGENGFDYEGGEKGKAEELMLEGAAAFKGGKLIGFLTDQETKGYMWLENEIGSRYVSTGEVDGVSLTVRVMSSSTKYTVIQVQGKPGLKYQVNVKGSIDEVKGIQPSMSIEEWNVFTKNAEKAVEEAITQECQAAIKKDQELAVDFLGIGRHIEQKKPSLWKEVRDNWESLLPGVPVELEVKATLEHGGVSRNSPVSPQESG